MDSKKEEIEAE